MNIKELAEYLDRTKRTLDNIENEVKDLDVCDFMSIISTTIDVYAKNHNIPARKLWTIMHKIAIEVNEVAPL